MSKWILSATSVTSVDLHNEFEVKMIISKWMETKHFWKSFFSPFDLFWKDVFNNNIVINDHYDWLFVSLLESPTLEL